ncbi:MAG: permease [Candidatus Sabulitectum sp.]|nr:permease [Candidatus Sabulitectum sp.]
MKSSSPKLDILFLCVALAMLFLAGDSPVIRTAFLSLSGIVLEALPFMLIGAIAGGLIEEYLPESAVTKLRYAKTKAIMIAALAGLVLPVCECAVIPVLYRLLRKGIPPEAALAYMLAGPVVNPVVFTSTLVAYQFNPVVPVLRVIAGYVIAVSVAIIVSRILKGKIVRDDISNPSPCEIKGNKKEPRIIRASRHAAEDILKAGKYFVMGALFAGLLQSAFGRNALLSIASNPVLAIAGMMVLAFLLSICADGDAFVAASFGKAFFPLSSQLAFMLFGPMLDIKLLLMYKIVFPWKTILVLIPCITVTVFLASLLLHLLIGAVL